MPLLEWNNTLLLGVEPFDEHHAHLFSLLNRTYDLIVTNAPDACFQKVFKELKDYTEYHFEAEEVWMHEQDYPQKQTHIHQHESFKKEIARFEEEFAADKKSVSISVLTFIKEWLLNHIYKIDAEYAAHVRSNANLRV
jgi:hemerythrin